jgi:hypothetical protein
MSKKWAVLLLSVVLCASVPLLAGSKNDVTYKLDGTQAAASVQGTVGTGAGTCFVNASFQPSPLPDGSIGYFVDIIFTMPPDNYGNYNEIGGLVPASAVKLEGSKVTVNITPDIIAVDPLYVNGTAGSFVGTFTPTTGPNSYSRTTNGNQTEVNVQSDGSTTTRFFTGTSLYSTAQFVGNVGSCSVSAPPAGGYVALGFRKGTERAVVTTP